MMTSYILRRLLLIIPTVFLALSFLFFLFFTLPGDPARLIAGGADRSIDAGVIERINDRYGLNDPILTQFTDYWQRTVKWDLGESFLNRRSVNDILGEKAVNSIRLGIWAIIIEIIVGISVGLLSALRRYSLSDKLTTIVTAAASAIPVFVLGFFLQWLFAVQPNKWGWPEWARLRTQGIGPDSWTFFFIPTGEQWRYLILPAITLASVSTALAARMTRGSMLEVMRADYMRTARAKGLTERGVVLKHGLRNAMLPVVTLIGIDFGTVIGAAVLTETTFSWPGLGSEIANSVVQRDLPVILGLTLVVVIAFAVINLLVDVSYAWFDPRIRMGKGEHS
jgi:ABC-type dipeptide/oligopeptide/nickel transport system permease component